MDLLWTGGVCSLLACSYPLGCFSGMCPCLSPGPGELGEGLEGDQAVCPLPPSGRDWLKTPSMVSQELPSPPHTRHLSSLESEPSTRSQPTCCGEEQQQ